jgi:hypothetical protein
MGRRIVTKRLEANLPGAKSISVDGYFDRVIKYIPSDVVAAWTGVTGLVNADAQAPQSTLLWILFGIFTLLTAGWTWKQTNERGRSTATTQILLATFSFVIWVFALGGPFATLEGFYRPLYGSLVLIVYTFVVGLVLPKEA